MFYRYTYDHAGRALNTFYQLNNDDEICLSAFSYDSIGRLVQNLLYNEQDTIHYSFDIRNMLTETLNKHFSERLYYADNISQFAESSPYYNGNISVLQTAWADTVNTYAYTYDATNRMIESEQLNENQRRPSEWFIYDTLGNILQAQRYSGNRLIDDLHFTYQEDGNQLLSVTDDGEDADLYSSIEYHNAGAQADTTMFYDANGNLIRDLDRGITSIRYNILNLPDTILFDNGNRIVNLYDAAGHKYKSIIHTNPITAVNPSNELVHMSYSSEGEYRITEYNGTIETCYTPRDTTLRIFNTIGYWIDNAYFYTLKDHLGDICAVVDASADTVVQRTMYYASGVPMAQSWGRDSQPYLYNGKEFVEAHGWNTYDYGFRGYYAPIGRFTSIDPLAEQSPWQSPYAYAGNNFINNIDWMGLAKLKPSTLHWVAVDQDDNILGLDLNSPDQGVYVVNDDKWDGTYWDLLRYELIGNHVGLGSGWGIGMNIRGLYNKSGAGYYNTAWGRNVAYGTTPRKEADLLVDIFRAEPLLVSMVLMSLSEEVTNGLFKGILWDSHFTYNEQALQILSRSGKLGAFIIKNFPTIISASMIGYNMYTEGFTQNNIGDAVVTALTNYLTYVAINGGIKGLAATIGTGATFALGAGVIAAEIYSACYGLTKITNVINTQLGNYSFFGNLYLNGPSY